MVQLSTWKESHITDVDISYISLVQDLPELISDLNFSLDEPCNTVQGNIS